MTDSSLPPTELSDLEDAGSADEDEGDGSTIDDATVCLHVVIANRNGHTVYQKDVLQGVSRLVLQLCLLISWPYVNISEYHFNHLIT